VAGKPCNTIEFLISTIEKTFPIPGRFRSKLPKDIAALSRLLTSARGERDNSYLNRPNLLSAYLRYFLPWNVYRLGRLFELNIKLPGKSGSQSILPELANGDAITDLGCGPLVLPITLWLAFPRLRKLELEFRCVDKSAAALEAGYKLFKVLSAAESDLTAWNIKIIHDSIEKPIRGKAAKLVTALNVFNEISVRPFNKAEQNAEKAAALLSRLCADNGSIFVMEPGNPQGGAFISALRASLLEKAHIPLAPCTHTAPCPVIPYTRSGKKDKWCHFSFTAKTKAVPAVLHKLSAAAGIPKERAVFSFLITRPDYENNSNFTCKQNNTSSILPVRIISDTFPIPPGRQKADTGCYACSENGLVLIAGSKIQLNGISFGTLLGLPFPKQLDKQMDSKSRALVVYIE